MHVVMITAKLMQASVMAHALKNQNINCTTATPGSLNYQWTPETDAILFPHPLDEKQIESIQKFLNEVSRKTPLIFFSPRQKNLFKMDFMKRYLAQSIFFDETLPLSQIPLLIKDILQKNSSKGREMKIGQITIDRLNRTLRLGQNSVVLSKKEFFLLELLILNSGRVTTRENIIDYVWDKRDYVGSNTIDVYISRLRKKLCDPETLPSNKTMIQTFPCLGYQLNL